MMMGSATTCFVGAGVKGIRVGASNVGVKGNTVGGTDVGVDWNKVGGADELLSWQPLTPNQNKNKSAAIFFKAWMVLKVFTLP